MATEVSICSNALLALGAQPIASFAEATDRARIVANLWPTVRDDVLRSHPWNCAIKRVELAPESAAPAFGWAYSYVLPGDWLRTLEVGDNNEYLTESGRILADITPLRLRYVWRNTEPGSWDSMLVKAMEYRMAMDLAYPITQSTSMLEARAGILASHMKQARAVDGQDDPPQQMGDMRLYASRFGRPW